MSNGLPGTNACRGSSSSSGICSSSLACKLLFSFLVAVHDHAVQKATGLAIVLTLLLGVVGFLGEVLLCLLIAGVVFVEVCCRTSKRRPNDSKKEDKAGVMKQAWNDVVLTVNLTI